MKINRRTKEKVLFATLSRNVKKKEINPNKHFYWKGFLMELSNFG